MITSVAGPLQPFFFFHQSMPGIREHRLVVITGFIIEIYNTHLIQFRIQVDLAVAAGADTGVNSDPSAVAIAVIALNL